MTAGILPNSLGRFQSAQGDPDRLCITQERDGQDRAARSCRAVCSIELSHAQSEKGAFNVSTKKKTHRGGTEDAENESKKILCDLCASVVNYPYRTLLVAAQPHWASRRRSLPISRGRAPPSPGRTATALAAVSRWRPRATARTGTGAARLHMRRPRAHVSPRE